MSSRNCRGGWTLLNNSTTTSWRVFRPSMDVFLEKAINLFKNNKSCADDKIVSEMLNVLDEDALDILAEAFIKGILNTESEFIWKNAR